jgi:septal ring factor EnvC (AmiA/AmiB activator)
MLGLKAYLIMGVVMLTMISGFYWYYRDSQARIALLTANNAKLELAVKTNEETIKSLQENYAAANAEISRVNEAFTAVRAQNRELADRLSEHDIAYLASKKPELVQRVINGASDKAARCFELLSGATLTDAERNAKDAKSFNSECPWMYDTLAH